MKPDISAQLLTQIDHVIKLAKEVIPRSRLRDDSGLAEKDAYKIITMATATIERVSGRNSVYTRQAEAVMSNNFGFEGQFLPGIVGVLESLYADVQDGYLQGVTELIHGELFGDFLEMARHLLEEGYKDPAAVVTGAALEAHLRQLCNKSGVDTELTTTSGVQPKKADQMNAELAKASVYSKLDQKNVTAWLGLRNSAAHGKFSDYSRDQVSLMVAGVQDFITRNPA